MYSTTFNTGSVIATGIGTSAGTCYYKPTATKEDVTNDEEHLIGD